MNVLSHIKLALFDWDGCLCDSRTMIWEANMFMLRHYQVPEMSLLHWLKTTHDSAESFIRAQGVDASTEEIKDLLSQYLNDNRGGVRSPSPLYPNVVELLDCLQQRTIPAFVISKHLEDHLIRDIENHGVSKYFKGVIGNPKVGTMDKAETMTVLCVTEGCNASEAFYIGDTVHDMHAAKVAGVYSVAISHGYDTRERLLQTGPDLLVGSLAELLECLT
jgi:phosphoglycolate phosphatase